MVRIDSDEYISLLKTKHQVEIDKAFESRSKLYKEIEKLKADIELGLKWLAPAPCCSRNILFGQGDNAAHIGQCPSCYKRYVITELEESTNE